MRSRSSIWIQFLLLFAMVLMGVCPAVAEEAPKSEAKLEGKIETKPEEVPEAVPASKPEPKIEIKLPTWSGDIRYRANQVKEDVDDARPYQQLRVRLGVQADVNDVTSVKIRLATATSAISTNQTMGDASDPGMPRRSFGIDLAYMDWHPSKDAKFWAGRTPNPFFTPGKVQTVYDADLAFEGLASQLSWKLPRGNVFANLGAFMISENYAKPDDVVDTGLAGFDVGYVLPTESVGEFTFHLGSHYFLNIQDKDIHTLDKGAKTDAYSYPYDRYRGNQVYPNDPLAIPADRRYYMQSKYNLSVNGAQWKITFGEHQILLFGEYVLNTGADDLKHGYEYGVAWTWGRSTFAGSQIFKQADSTVGAFTDSDANGGGTDNNGYKFNWSYQLSKASQFVLSYYDANRGMDSVPHRYFGTQADLVVMF